MSTPITLSIDLKKLDKSRFKTYKRENGPDSLYANLIIFETKKGDLIVKENTSKEERENGLELPIIGNAKIVGRGDASPEGRPQGPSDRSYAPRPQPQQANLDDDIPF
jgi:hypothetical protein